MAPYSLDAVAKRLRRAIAAVRVGRALLALLAIAVSAALGKMGAAWIRQGMTGLYSPSPDGGLVPGLLVLTIIAYMAVFDLTRRLGSLARRLAASDPAADLGALLDAVHYERPRRNAVLVTACAQRLEALGADDDGALNAKRRGWLRWHLSWATQPRSTAELLFQVAAFRALAAVGDMRALPIAERRAGSSNRDEVRAAAASAAVRLRIVAEQIEAGSDTLLRPSDSAADGLLRPARGSTEPEALLRASTGPNETSEAE